MINLALTVYLESKVLFVSEAHKKFNIMDFLYVVWSSIRIYLQEWIELVSP